MEKEFIRKDLASSIGSGEHSEVYLEVDIKTGESELIISKTIIERYPVTKYNKVMNLFKSITGGGGRRIFRIKDFKKP